MLVTMPLLGGGGASPLLGEVPEGAMSPQRGGNEKWWWCPGCGRNAHATGKICAKINERRRKDCVVVAAVSDCACLCVWNVKK